MRLQQYPKVSIIIIGDESAERELKRINTEKLSYPKDKTEIILAGRDRINTAVSNSTGEILIFTNVKDHFDLSALEKITERFADDCVGSVCGVMQKKSGGESLLWRYENAVRRYESGIGQLSGANDAILAIRKNCVTSVPDKIVNYPFYLSYHVLQSGYDCVCEDEAKAYGVTAEVSYCKHITDGISNYQLMSSCCKMKTGIKSSFIYFSHRVMKWLVPFNMVLALVISIILAIGNSWFWISVLSIQVVLYTAPVLCHILISTRQERRGGMVLGIINASYYFISLNFAYLLGFFKWLFNKEYHV